MHLKQLVHPVWLGLASTVSAIGLHAAHQGLLQISPSFSGDGVTLYPALNPGHDAKDLTHLVPDHSRELYYTQEGHRPALHGAKHAYMKAVFTHPTIVLEHSDHVRSVKCYPHDEAMEIGFKSVEAFNTVRASWLMQDILDPVFNLVTYHVGCGDEMTGKRSFFRASEPMFNPETRSVVVSAKPIGEHEALDSGEIRLGTYSSPHHQKRQPAQGHVRVVHDAPNPPNGTHWNQTRTVDLSHDLVALRRFFYDDSLSGTDMDKPVDTPLDTVDEDGLVEVDDDDARHLSKRETIFEGIWNGVLNLVKGILNFFGKFLGPLGQIRVLVFNWALVGVKLILAAFTVPFDHSYHNDFKFTDRISPSSPQETAPGIFKNPGGLLLNHPGEKYSIQCVDCGIEAEFNVNAHLAFSIKDGITKGEVSLVNNNPIKLDAVFGIAAKKTSFSFEKRRRQFKAYRLHPFEIPGIVALGPQISLALGVEIAGEGDFSLLVGGKYTLSPGSAVLDVKNKGRSGIKGLEPKFKQVAKFSGGEIKLTAALGIPIALEVGLDVLNGRFKRTVGLVDTHALFVSATYNGGNNNCKNGAEIKTGMRKTLALEAFKKWKENIIKPTTMFEQTLGCVDSKGTLRAKDTKGVIDTVDKKIDTKKALEKPDIQNYAANLTSSEYKLQGFRLVMDADEKTVLVSGRDGGLYLVDKAKNYDLSAPWGTVNMTADVLTYDTFGRVMAYDHTVYSQSDGFVTGLSVRNETKMPDRYRAMTLSLVKDEKGEKESYAVALVTGSNEYKVLFPTVCKTKNGSRLFGTAYLYGKDGKVRRRDGSEPRGYGRGTQNVWLAFLGAQDPKNNCVTARLVSTLKGSGG